MGFFFGPHSILYCCTDYTLKKKTVPEKSDCRVFKSNISLEENETAWFFLHDNTNAWKLKIYWKILGCLWSRSRCGQVMYSAVMNVMNWAGLLNDFFHHDSDAFLFLVRLPIYSLHLTFKCWGCTVVVLFFFLLLTYLLLFSVFGSYYLMTRAKVLTFFYIYCMVLCKCDAREARDHGISSKYLSNSYYLFVDMVVAIAVVFFFSFFCFSIFHWTLC